MSRIETGQILELRERGYGHILSPASSRLLWFHANGLVNRRFDALKVGHGCTFRIAESAEHGTMASEIDITDAPDFTPLREHAIVENLERHHGFLNTGGVRRLFFFDRYCANFSFNELYPGAQVSFIRARNDRGAVGIDVRIES